MPEGFASTAGFNLHKKIYEELLAGYDWPRDIDPDLPPCAFQPRLKPPLWETPQEQGPYMLSWDENHVGFNATVTGT